MLLNCGVGEDSWESLGLQGDQNSQSKGNESWIFIRRPDPVAEVSIVWPPDAKKLTHLKRLWCWARLKAGGEGDDRGWDGWMVSLIQWTWVWVNPGNWWWTGRPGMLQSMGLQSVRHDWVTELNWRYFLGFPTSKLSGMFFHWPGIPCLIFQPGEILVKFYLWEGVPDCAC